MSEHAGMRTVADNICEAFPLTAIRFLLSISAAALFSLRVL